LIVDATGGPITVQPDKNTSLSGTLIGQ
jgi:hypothetical protein